MHDAVLALIRDAHATLAAAEALLAQSDVITVRPGDTLPSVLEQAPDGAIVQMDPAFVHVGALTLTKPVTLRSPVVSTSRVSGDMVGPILRGAVVIQATDVTLAGLRLEGLVKDSTILTTGVRTTVDGCVVMGTAQGQHRGIAVNSEGVTIGRCHVANIWHTLDTQAVGGWTGTKNLLVDDCYLEASGENVFFGGASVPDDLIPQDITVRGCTLSKPLAWKAEPTQKQCKNLFEIKAGKRIVLEDCLLDHSWPGGGQSGYGIVLTVRNPSNTAPTITIEDITIRRNIIRGVGAGVNILGREDGTRLSGIMARVAFEDNRIELDQPQMGGSGILFLVQGGPSDLSIRGTDSYTTGWVNSAFTLGKTLCERLIIDDNPRLLEGDYGIRADGMALGRIVLDTWAPGYVWARNGVVKGPSGRWIAYPIGTTFVP